MFYALSMRRSMNNVIDFALIYIYTFIHNFLFSFDNYKERDAVSWMNKKIVLRI